MYLRFTTTLVDANSHKPQGVFQAAYRLIDSGALEADEWTHLREILNWFNQNLPHPPETFEASRAIFWFRPEADDCISKLWELIAVLREHDYHVVTYKCRRLGNVVYYDRFQVAAYPSDLDHGITMS